VCFEEHGCPSELWRRAADGLRALLSQARLAVESVREMTTNGGAMAFLLQQHRDRLCMYRNSAAAFGLWLIRRRLFGEGTRLQDWCDRTFSDCPVVDSGRSDHVTTSICWRLSLGNRTSSVTPRNRSTLSWMQHNSSQGGGEIVHASPMFAEDRPAYQIPVREPGMGQASRNGRVRSDVRDPARSPAGPLAAALRRQESLAIRVKLLPVGGSHYRLRLHPCPSVSSTTALVSNREPGRLHTAVRTPE
jgi:hypothetical protein